MTERHKELMDRGILEYWTERDVSRVTKFGLQTLRNWRHERRGIPYLKISGGSIRYKPEDVQKFMEITHIEPGAAK